MGGLSLAARDLGMQVVAGVDIDAHAARTYSKNFPEAEFIEGSVRSSRALRRCSELLISPTTTTTPVVVVSGPPCQGFSKAGTRDPVDPRNQVLSAVARAIVKLAPQCALVENVATVLSQLHAARLDRFKETLSGAGYFLQSVVVDAAAFGVPQKRKRAFFLISRLQLEYQDVLDRLERWKCTELTVEAALRGLPPALVRPDHYDDESDYGHLHNHLAMQHSDRVRRKIAALEPGSGPMSYRKLHPAKPARTLFSGHRAPPAHFAEPRSITVREAARLQGFPDHFRVYGSFGNQMQQVTNSVPPPLARAVLSVLMDLTGVCLPLYA